MAPGLRDGYEATRTHLTHILRHKPDIVETIQTSRGLIIDEGSMIDSDKFTLGVKLIRDIRGDNVPKLPTHPTGGMMVIMIVDFYQLEPVFRQ